MTFGHFHSFWQTCILIHWAIENHLIIETLIIEHARIIEQKKQRFICSIIIACSISMSYSEKYNCDSLLNHLYWQIPNLWIVCHLHVFGRRNTVNCPRRTPNPVFLRSAVFFHVQWHSYWLQLSSLKTPPFRMLSWLSSLGSCPCLD